MNNQNNQNKPIEATEPIEAPETIDEFAPEQNPEEVTIAITSDIDTIKAIELLFAPNIEELQETQPELFQYYSLFGAAEGLLRSAKLLSYAAPDHPEIAESIATIAKVVSQTGIEMFNDAKETLTEQEKLNLTTSNSMEKIKMNSNQVKNIMDQIGKIDVSLPDHLK